MATVSPLWQASVAGSSREPATAEIPERSEVLKVLEIMDAVPKRWSLTREGLDKLLACLHPDRETAGHQYELIRSKLINYFDWRDCPFPEEHADDAINRVIRKLDAGEEFRDLATYVFGVARMMLLEIARTRDKEQAALNLFTASQPPEEPSSEDDLREECLKQCLAALSDSSRALITEYYVGDGSAKIRRRQELARRLGVQLNALRIRACRLRGKLEECMGRCLTTKARSEML